MDIYKAYVLSKCCSSEGPFLIFQQDIDLYYLHFINVNQDMK